MRKYMCFNVSLLMVSISGCASTHHPDPLADLLESEPDEIVCKYIAPKGSRVPRSVCMSQSAWDAKKEETKEILDELLRS